MIVTSELLSKPVLLAGVDEAGRGPLAGPVVAAAVILGPKTTVSELKDSKQLSESKREVLFQHIKDTAIAWAIGRAEVEEIDSLNILQASLLAMKRAVLSLSVKPAEVWIDGRDCLALEYKMRAIIQGDKLIPEISAASILAKVTRDREMLLLDEQYPGYGFAKHKGYPTAHHVNMLKIHGISGIHRRSFAPVKKCLEQVHAT